LIPVELAKKITETLDIPTIGIGAGIHCDGQIQVFHDMLGLDPDFRPRHSGKYADLAPVIENALVRYVDDVREGTFPTDAQSFFSDESRIREGSKTND
jgi:3-methyl-2-oxobutanoate hydroxymethyltransferase